MSKRQASIATFLSPRQTATSSVKRAAVDASADSPAKRARRAAIRAAAEVKREDSPNVELTGGAGGSPETKSSPASTADKGKGKAVELDLSLYNGDMKPEEAEMLAIAESVKNARATAGRNVEAADTKKDIIELDDLDTESKPGESSRSPLLSPVVKPSPTPIAKIKAGQSGTTPSHLPFTFPPPDHPSYHLPPSPTYNHPITIVPPSASLVDAMRFNTVPRSITSPADLDLLYFTKFIDPTCSRLLTKYLLDSLPWYRVNYTTKGIDIKTPRYTTVFGKDATAMPWEVYDKWKPRAIPEILLRLMQKGQCLDLDFDPTHEVQGPRHIVTPGTRQYKLTMQSKRSPARPTTSPWSTITPLAPILYPTTPTLSASSAPTPA